MKLTALSTALIIAAAAPAVAGPQLAASIGVTPGVYTLSELGQLKAAKEDGQVAFDRMIRSLEAQTVSTPRVGNTDQLAASIGVAPGRFTIGELAQLKMAREEGDDEFRVTLARLERPVVSTQSFGISAGHRQLAAQLRVNPDDVSLKDLVRMKAERDAD